MKALRYERYGPPEVLELVEMAKPEPAAGEVLLEVKAAALNAADVRLMRADPFFVRFFNGLLRPRIRPGSDVAGIVRRVGAGVAEFAVGDEVFGDIFDYGAGAVAEYATAGVDVLVRKPDNVSFVAAAALPVAGLTALQSLRDKGGIAAGQRVLINGASGGVGTFALQLAKAFGAEVTAVCSTGKLEQARQLGADHVIDYRREDFTRNGRRYDLIVACNGSQSLFEYLRSLTPTGTFVAAGGDLGAVFGAMLLGPLYTKPAGRTVTNCHGRADKADLRFLAGLLESGGLQPVIDRTYDLTESVEAFRYLDAGHARGKVVVTIEAEEN